MTTPQITVTFNPPLSTDSGAEFDAKSFDTVAKWNPWGVEANALTQFNNEKALECAATALSGDLPDMTGQAGKLIGVNSAEDRAVFYAPIIGQCRLRHVSDTKLSLEPSDGNAIKVNGAISYIPSAGVSLSNSGLAVSTDFNVFAYIDTGAVTLEASTTATAIDATSENVGIVIKAGDSTRTFVGTISTDGSGNFRPGKLTSHFNSYPDWEVLFHGDVSGVASVSKTDLEAYSTIEIDYFMTPSTSGVYPVFRVSKDNGATWVSSSTDYYDSHSGSSGTASTNPAAYGGIGTTTGTTTGCASSGRVIIYGLNDGAHATWWNYFAGAENSSIIYSIAGTGTVYDGGAASVNNAIQIFYTSGTIAHGHITIRGRRG